MESLFRDLRVALRGLSRQPSFSILAILTLGLGIGGSTAIFSVIDAALLRPLPYANPEQLVDIGVEVAMSDGRPALLGPSVQDVQDWQRSGVAFSHLAIWRNQIRPVIVDGPRLERVSVRDISEGYLAVHGVVPLLGRGIEAADTHEGAPPVVLLGYDFWRTRFDSNQDVIGRVVMVDNAPATIVGILPPAFYRDSTLWRPFRTTARMFDFRGSGATVYGRLQPGVSLQAAQRLLEQVTAAYARERGRPTPAAVRIESLYEVTTRGYRQTTTILAAAVAMILLIGCVNVAGLLLARGAARQSELAVRVAMGASRAKVVRQLLTESLVLAALGGLAGMAMAWVSLDVIVANIPMSLPANSAARLNANALAFAAAVSMATGIAFGLLPALKLSKVSVKDALSRADRRHGSALSRRGGQVLISVEVALALVLLAGAGLMIRSFARVISVDLGFDLSAIVTMEVAPVDPDPKVAARFYPQLVQAVRELPGIEAAGAVDHLAVAGGSTQTRVTTEGQSTSLNIRYFVPGYFEAVGMSLKDGRLPAAAAQPNETPVAVLNELGAKKLYPGGGALGRRLEVMKVTYEVVGVVGDVRHDGPLRPPRQEVFLAFGVADTRALIVVARPHPGMPGIEQQLRQAANSLGTRALVHRVRRGNEWLGDRVVTPRRRTVLLAILGGLGLLLTIVGVFGTTAYVVSRRTQEIGIRMAFGARPQQIVNAIVRDAMWPVAAGIIVGLAGATMASRLIASFLFETQTTDAPTYAAVAGVLAAAVLIAAWIPSRHAARIDPVVALRQE